MDGVALCLSRQHGSIISENHQVLEVERFGVTLGRRHRRIRRHVGSGGQPYTASDFSAQAPAFTWEVGAACPTTVVGCISVQVFDASATGDSQGVSLAVDSPLTNTCWYAFDVESDPGTPLAANFPTAGVWYGQQSGIPTAGCLALNPDSDTGVKGFGGANLTGTNYANAPSIS